MNRALAHLLTPSLAQPFTQSVSGLWKNFKTDGKMSSKGGFDTDGDHRSKPRLQLKTNTTRTEGIMGPEGRVDTTTYSMTPTTTRVGKRKGIDAGDQLQT